MKDKRIEKDSMGEMEVPQDALYGASTQRAVLNFPISKDSVDSGIIHAYGLIKGFGAKINGELGFVDKEKCLLIEKVAREIFEGKLDEHFPVDVFQTGSGTSTNMNVNEVIANRCSQISGEKIGSKIPIHPNDHVNQGQSSNDTFPTAIHIAVAVALKKNLLPSLEKLHESFAKKSEEFKDVLKIGRTHLMDATPVRLGQVFSGYSRQTELSIRRVKNAIDSILELPLGGTAVGTGLNCHPDFAHKVIDLIAKETGINFTEASDHFESQGAKDGLLECHGFINVIAGSLYKIANDIRLLASGPRCGIGEISLPATQPGSSIMPGKVNPVMCEAVTMVAARVFGNHNTVTWSVANGHFELNVFMPVMAKAILESIDLLHNVIDIFRVKCLDGIQANEKRSSELIEWSMSMVTSLAPKIGYDKASKIAKQSVELGKTVREICEENLDEFGLSLEELNSILDPKSMT